MCCFPSMPFLSAVMQIAGGNRRLHLWSVSLGTILILVRSRSPMHFLAFGHRLLAFLNVRYFFMVVKTEVHFSAPTQGALDVNRRTRCIKSFLKIFETMPTKTLKGETFKNIQERYSSNLRKILHMIILNAEQKSAP